MSQTSCMSPKRGIYDLSRPFTRQQALAAGMTDLDLRHSRYVRLFQGVYVGSDVPRTTALLAAGALAAAPVGAVVAGHSAARLWGGVVPDSADVTLRLAPGQRMRVRGIRVLRRELPQRQVRRFGLPVTTPEDTFLDLATSLDLVELVVAGDALVRRGHTSAAALGAAAKEGTLPSARLARRAAAFVRAGVDSPQESRARMLLVLAGLPEPEVNSVIRARDGSWVRRHDLAYETVKVAIEYDGGHHAPGAVPMPGSPLDRSQWERDIRRREEAEADGWRMIVLLASDLSVTPAETLDRVVRVLRERGMRARVRRQEWRRYFPGRVAA